MREFSQYYCLECNQKTVYYHDRTEQGHGNCYDYEVCGLCWEDHDCNPESVHFDGMFAKLK